MEIVPAAVAGLSSEISVRTVPRLKSLEFGLATSTPTVIVCPDIVDAKRMARSADFAFMISLARPFLAECAPRVHDRIDRACDRRAVGDHRASDAGGSRSRGARRREGVRDVARCSSARARTHPPEN